MASGKGIIAHRSRMARRIGRRVAQCNPKCMRSTPCKRIARREAKRVARRVATWRDEVEVAVRVIVWITCEIH
jgi:hypothetical protein